MTEDTLNESKAPVPSADEVVARKAELEGHLKVAVDAAVKAGFELQTAHYHLRDLEWLSTAAGHDAATWTSIAEAVGALPADATAQQIALAQAQAIATSKQHTQRQVAEQLPAVRELIVATAKAYDEKEQSVDEVKGDLLALSPMRNYLKHAPAVLSGTWLMGLFNKSFFGKG
jgi:uncharacterized protein YdaU (DUF1376 family)